MAGESGLIASTEVTRSGKPNLLGLSPVELVAFFESIGEKKFRATQLLKWMHQDGVDNFDEMSNISKPLREKLKRVAIVEAPAILEQVDSKDGTRKFLFEIGGLGSYTAGNSNAVETVFIPEGDRGTLCVSSQVGCSLDCSFCATGKQGFNRDLTSA
jgi:23S rRNA (adenine2503-C2)-methyltransferase